MNGYKRRNDVEYILNDKFVGAECAASNHYEDNNSGSVFALSQALHLQHAGANHFRAKMFDTSQSE